MVVPLMAIRRPVARAPEISLSDGIGLAERRIRVAEKCPLGADTGYHALHRTSAGKPWRPRPSRSDGEVVASCWVLKTLGEC